jgi:hypothetical protein
VSLKISILNTSVDYIKKRKLQEAKLLQIIIRRRILNKEIENSGKRIVKEITMISIKKIFWSLSYLTQI